MFNWFQRRLNAFPLDFIHTPPQSFWAFMLMCAKGAKKTLFCMTMLTALIAAVEAYLFGAMGQIVDWLSHISPQTLWQTEHAKLLFFAAILLSSPILVALQTLVKHQILAGNFPMRLRWNFHRLMLNQSMRFYQDEFAGRVAAKVMQTALAVRDVWFILADILVYVGVYFATMVVVAGNFSLWLLPSFLLWLTLYCCSLAYFIPRLAKISQAQADARSLMTGRITDAYSNIATVKLFSHAGREASYAKTAMQEFLGTVHGQMELVSKIEMVNQSLNVLLIMGATGTALWLWSTGQAGVGAVAAVTAMAMRLNGISHWVMWEMTSLFEQVGTVTDGMNMLSKIRTVTDAPEAKRLIVKTGEINFEQVSFSYNGQKHIIEDFNLNIKPGEKIGLVGKSGAGKSTLVNLLLRFYDIERGRILIDGQDIKNVSQESLRAQIGMVTQDNSLLHRSLRDNILYGRPEATETEMLHAASRAEAHDFTQFLSDANQRRGYDAHVGERGVKLSGGQRQRIAIARVMLKNAPILLLDEATSALDSEVENIIQDSLYKLMEGKTVVAIAHRLSTIAAMDRLVVIDEGQIVELGSHDQLLAKNGLYAKLWARQSGGFLAETI